MGDTFTLIIQTPLTVIHVRMTYYLAMPQNTINIARYLFDLKLKLAIAAARMWPSVIVAANVSC